MAHIGTELIILILGILLFTAVVTTTLSNKLGLPSLIVFLAVGMFMNIFYKFDNAYLAQLIGNIALVIILFDGGIQTTKQTVKRAISYASILATIGVLITSLIVALGTMFILNMSWQHSLLVGAIVGSTDAAAVFSILGNKRISPKIKSILEVESGTNDPMALFLTITMISIITMPDASIFNYMLMFIWQMLGGALLGLLVGYLTLKLINFITLEATGLYPILAITLSFITFGIASYIHVSGLLSVYVFALFLGNHPLSYRTSIIRFGESFAWIGQMAMFILLGLLVFPTNLVSVMWEGLLIALVLMIIARPLSVWLTLSFTDLKPKELWFISWAGLRGAVPIILATYALLDGVKEANLIFNVVFFVVLLSALLQGMTLEPLANKLGLSKGEAVTSPYQFYMLASEVSKVDIREYIIRSHSKWNGKTLADLDLPRRVNINAVVRDDELHIPDGNFSLKANDIIYILAEKDIHQKLHKLQQKAETQKA
ncbi:potassium/proton antiporter [Staphylococcus massiliensis]|uniref:potassium/proton antiporter n=1 Tax=Staphylococcus massiliensis TaxID=555791 RepID=UPI001EDD0C8E|nr:potassium/proton antiporter [Staphylococcus massiliensis]